MEPFRRIVQDIKDFATLARIAVTLIGIIAYCELRNE